MRNNNLFGLPAMSLNILSGACGIGIICLGVRIARASDVALKVANTQLITGSSAKKLEELAKRLEMQAEIIKQKDQAYQELQGTYDDYIHSRKGNRELEKAIEAVEDLPEVDNVDDIKQEISEAGEVLNQVSTE